MSTNVQDLLDMSLDDIAAQKKENNPANGGGKTRRERKYDRPAPYAQKDSRRRAPPPPRGAVGCRVYIGNLAYSVSWQTLKDHLRQAGDVQHVEILQFPDGKSKGCGIAVFSTPEEAENAIATLTDSTLDGRMIFVREDREDQMGPPSGGGGRGPPPPARAPSRGGGYSRGAGGGPAACKVVVSNLAWETKWWNLKDFMREAGEVLHCDIFQDHTGRSKGSGLVEFSNPTDAKRAIRNLSGVELDGRPVYIREYEEIPNHSSRRDSGPSSSEIQLWVGNLPFETSWQDLKDHFKSVGDVRHVDILVSRDGRPKGQAVVRFGSEREAADAIRELNGVDFQGRPLQVKYDEKL